MVCERIVEATLCLAVYKGLGTKWYVLMMCPNYMREHYNYGFCLQFYI